MFLRDSDGVWHHEECSLVTLGSEKNQTRRADLAPEIPGDWCDHCLPDPDTQ